MPQLNRIYALLLNNGDPVPLDSTPRIVFSVGHLFRVTHDRNGSDDPYRVTTIEYWYQFALPDRSEVLAYHWTPETRDPNQRTFPHLHVGSAIIEATGPFSPDTFSKLHVPTARVPLESVIRFAIEELNARPVHGRWNEVLSAGETAFSREFRAGEAPDRD